MFYEYPKYKNTPHNVHGILGGLVIGSFVGALAMLFLAPRSGKDTRRHFQNKGIGLRDRTTEMVENTRAQVRMNPQKVEMGIKNYEQLENIADVA